MASDSPAPAAALPCGELTPSAGLLSSSPSVRPWQSSRERAPHAPGSRVPQPGASFPKSPTVPGPVACVSVLSRQECGALSPLESAAASDGQDYPSFLPLAGAVTHRLQGALVACTTAPQSQPLSFLHSLSHSSIQRLALPGVISQINCLPAKLYVKASFWGVRPQTG